MPQPGFRYPHLAIHTHPSIYNALAGKYGQDEVAWPVIWYQRINGQPSLEKALTFEVNNQNQVNLPITGSSQVIHGLHADACKLDYTNSPTSCLMLKGTTIPSFVKAATGVGHTCSHDYITSSSNATHETIDVDYLWHNGTRNRALEVSTFWKEMVDKSTAEYLVGHFVRKRAQNADQFPLLVLAAAQLLNSDMLMVFVNEKDGNLVTSGNAYWFPLDQQQIRQFQSGSLPHTAQFGAFQHFLATL